MTAETIEVEFYSGGRADERPRSVTIDGRKHVVARLLSDSLEEAGTPGGRGDRVHRYRILTEGGLVLELVQRHDGSWMVFSI